MQNIADHAIDFRARITFGLDSSGKSFFVLSGGKSTGRRSSVQKGDVSSEI